MAEQKVINDVVIHRCSLAMPVIGERAACKPSLPLLPAPTCPSWIVWTLLAPSPTASVRTSKPLTGLISCTRKTSEQLELYLDLDGTLSVNEGAVNLLAFDIRSIATDFICTGDPQGTNIMLFESEGCDTLDLTEGTENRRVSSSSQTKGVCIQATFSIRLASLGPRAHFNDVVSNMEEAPLCSLLSPDSTRSFLQVQWATTLPNSRLGRS
jgi:hypothetical protein